MKRLIALAVALAMVTAACSSGEPEALDPVEAEQQLTELVNDIDWEDAPVTRREAVPPPTSDLAATLPDIDLFPLVVVPRSGSNQTVAEVFVSTEKSGDGTDGWMVEVAESFNDSGQTLSDGVRFTTF